MKKLICLMLISMGVLSIAQAQANGFEVKGHLGWPMIRTAGGAQNLGVTSAGDNLYRNTSIKTNGPLLGIGLAYGWDLKSGRYSVGPSLYNMRYSVAGVNSPLASRGSFDTLDYKIKGLSTVLLIENRFVFTQYKWQPYLLAGLGFAQNKLSDYTETPTDPNSSARPGVNSFESATKTGFAYELGLGVQRALFDKSNAPIIAFDYRYMGLGTVVLKNTSAGGSRSDLNFGQVLSHVLSVGVIWPF